MSNRMPDRQYEELYTELLDRGDQLHSSNKRRIRRGIVFLIILPVVLDFIRWITDSDKVVFLIIWIMIMFVVSAYLISIEYLDSAIESTLKDVTDTEAEFDDLLPRPDLRRTDLHERIVARIAERRAERVSAEEAALEKEAERVRSEVRRTEAEEAELEAELRSRALEEARHEAAASTAAAGEARREAAASTTAAEEARLEAAASTASSEQESAGGNAADTDNLEEILETLENAGKEGEL